LFFGFGIFIHRCRRFTQIQAKAFYLRKSAPSADYLLSFVKQGEVFGVRWQSEAATPLWAICEFLLRAKAASPWLSPSAAALQSHAISITLFYEPQ